MSYRKISLNRQPKSLLWLALASALLLPACVSAPDSKPQLQALDGQQLGLAQEALPEVGNGWWQLFGDEQLNQLVDQALANNPSLNQAIIRVRAAQAQAIAAGAPLKPGFSLNGEETYQRLSENYIYPPAQAGFGIAGGDKVWLGQTTLNLNWDLDFWGHQADLLKQAKANALAAELDAGAAKLALSGALAQSYVQLYSAYAQGDIARAALQQRQQIYTITQARVKAGLDTQVELKGAEAALPQARMAVMQADIARDMAVHSLAALTGQGPSAYGQITRPSVDLHTKLPLPQNLPLDLLARRPDLLAAKARVEAASAGRAAAKSAFYPDISLNAFVGTQAIGLSNLTDAGSLIYGAGPAVHLPIFDSQRLKAGFLVATAELDAAVANYNTTLLRAVQDTANQLTRSQSYQAQLTQATQALEAAQTAYKLAQNRYKAGLSSQLVVLNAQTQLLAAQRDLVDVNTQLVISRVSLLLNLGGSFSPSGDSAAAPQAKAATPRLATPLPTNPSASRDAGV